MNWISFISIAKCALKWFRLIRRKWSYKMYAVVDFRSLIAIWRAHNSCDGAHQPVYLYFDWHERGRRVTDLIEFIVVWHFRIEHRFSALAAVDRHLNRVPHSDLAPIIACYTRTLNRRDCKLCRCDVCEQSTSTSAICNLHCGLTDLYGIFYYI